jgi:hypothetical protein
MTVVEGPNAGTDFVPKADVADIQVSSEACSNDAREQKKKDAGLCWPASLVSHYAREGEYVPGPPLAREQKPNAV